jgi:hypothetical protein
MTRGLGERNHLALLGLLATVAMSLSFWTAVDDHRYVTFGALVGGAAVLLGMGLRALHVAQPFVVLAQFVLLAQLLLWGFGADLRWGVLPTSRTWSHLNDVLATGIDTANQYAAPAPRDPGLLLMLVFFVALIAILVDLAIAANRVPLAGLPLLALYTVPVAALPEGVPFLGFVAGAAAYIGLLTAAERDRLAHWGRLVAKGSVAHADDQMDTSGLRSSGQRVAVLALSIAVVVPLLVPTLSSSLLDRGRGLGDGSGSWRFEDPMVSLAAALRRDEEVDLLQVNSDVMPTYLRMTVLDVPGPNEWTTGSFDSSDTIPVNVVLPRPPGVSSAVEETAHTMSIDPTDEFPRDSSWFPVPFNASSIGISSDDWAYFAADQTVVARNSSAATEVEEFGISFGLLDPTSEQLEAALPADPAIVDEYIEVPGTVPEGVINEARVITAGALTDYQRAVMLQAHFRDTDRFTYDVEAGYGYGYQAMVEFLEERRGFCQHFAATMAMMARSLDIPARVVVGFLRPTESVGDDYIFTSHDLHAWPELYFEGVGWVRFEPTPGVGAPLPPWAREANPTLGPSTAPTNPAESTDPFATRLNSTTNSTDAAAGDQAAGGSGGAAPSPWWLLPPGLLILALLPGLIRRGVRRHRLSRPVDDPTAAEAAWTELRDRMRDLRLPWSGSMTPRAREHAVAPHLAGDPDALAALRRLARSVERSRYAATPMTDVDPAHDAETVMTALVPGVGRLQRIRAFWWPSSLMPDIARGWATVRRRLRRAPATAP